MTERRLEAKNHFAVEMDHMAKSIRAGTKPRTPGEEGMQDMRLIASIYEAAQSGQTVKLVPVNGLDVYRGAMPG